MADEKKPSVPWIFSPVTGLVNEYIKAMKNKGVTTPGYAGETQYYPPGPNPAQQYGVGKGVGLTRRKKLETPYINRYLKELEAAIRVGGKKKGLEEAVIDAAVFEGLTDAQNIISSEGWGSFNLAGSDYLPVFKDWRDVIKTGNQIASGVTMLNGVAYDNYGSPLASNLQDYYTKVQAGNIRMEELPGEMFEGWAEANELLAQKQQAYKAVQREWSESLETPWVIAPGESFSSDRTMRERELGIPERIWTDPNFQNAYETALVRIKEAQAFPYWEGGEADAATLMAEAIAKIPESTIRASEQMARKEV